MEPGDIVITLRDLDWGDDHCPAGTRMVLRRVRQTSNGPRWTGSDRFGIDHHNIPPEDIAVIA